MTLREIYLTGRKTLEEAGIDTPAFDASALFEQVFGMDNAGRLMHGAEQAGEAEAARFYTLAAERAAGRPLQYILGEWPFFGFAFRVGEGVLIPREETELLVRTAGEILRGEIVGRRLQAVDLCGGSGAVAVGLSLLLPSADVFCVEWQEEAWRYLQENIKRFEAAQAGGHVETRRLDVLDPSSAEGFCELDAILSNPPYVESGELPTLQKEVRREPGTALDGGEDGLVFYRAIASVWVPKLRAGGLLAVEIGETQAKEVSALFLEAGISRIAVLKDFNGFDRVVIGRRKEE